MTREISFPDFLRAVSIPMFGFAIVNPMGPTFMGFAIGKSNSGDASLLFFSLNPFTQSAKEITTYNFDPLTIDLDLMLREFEIFSAIDKFLLLQKSNKNEFGTPTLLLGVLDANSEEAIKEERLISLSIIRHSNDPLSTLQSLNQFPMNVMDRVSHEMSKIAPNSGQSSEKQSPTDTQVSEILDHICNPEHIKQEFKGFNIAWTGAINFQKERGNVNLANNALSLQESLGHILRLFTPLMHLMKG